MKTLSFVVCLHMTHFVSMYFLLFFWLIPDADDDSDSDNDEAATAASVDDHHADADTTNHAAFRLGCIRCLCT